ncbi:hypothetical protein [Methylobacterium radiotolerans]|uniref:hypothetical protein n=1 Tax=Methylobacterium radiotolerans TaxID=31998 RepID=UPI0015F3954C|nr:hypothetical protein [Methylobacterium radiotolerans]
MTLFETGGPWRGRPFSCAVSRDRGARYPQDGFAKIARTARRTARPGAPAETLLLVRAALVARVA